MYSIALALVVIGGINWGLIGFLGYDRNLVHFLLVDFPMVERIVYMAVGVAAVYVLFNWRHYR